MKQIDLNCDIGEGLENENELLPYISSCSIACGGHAGDPQSMDMVIGLALQNGVKIGAHPSYPDRENFGRKTLKMDQADFVDSIRVQLNTFSEILHMRQGILNHIKPHGALYNDLVKDKGLSRVFLKAITPYREGVKLYAPFGSVIAEEAQNQGWSIVYEAFGDRNYNDDLSLVSRTNPNALILEPREVLEHVLHIILKSKVKTAAGRTQTLEAETICLHGDSPGVLQILMYLSQELPKNDVQVI